MGCCKSKSDFNTGDSNFNFFEITILKNETTVVSICYDWVLKSFTIRSKSFSCLWRLHNIDTLLDYIHYILLNKKINIDSDNLTIHSSFQIDLPYSSKHLKDLLQIVQSMCVHEPHYPCCKECPIDFY